jgi:hypothetical protein
MGLRHGRANHGIRHSPGASPNLGPKGRLVVGAPIGSRIPHPMLRAALKATSSEHSKRLPKAPDDLRCCVVAPTHSPKITDLELRSSTGRIEASSAHKSKVQPLLADTEC